MIAPGMKFGKLTVLEKAGNRAWKCICECGNVSFPNESHLLSGHTKSCGSCGKNSYEDCDDGKSVAVTTTNGVVFFIDKADEPLVRQYKWHCCTDANGIKTIATSKRQTVHDLLLNTPKGMEGDHIDLNRLNNRRSNLRIVTHQQNQCNQPLQRNNTSGVSGVSYYPPRRKFRARIKACQHDIHLGYYSSFKEAVQARNVGMEFMFGEYGRYNDVPDAPAWIRKTVDEKCRRFADLSVCRAFSFSESRLEVAGE